MLFVEKADAMLPRSTYSKSSHNQTDAFTFNVAQQSSTASFLNLSINDCESAVGSQYSQYNPSINEPLVEDDATPDEKQMHTFLDMCGVFQINIKQQLEIEKKQKLRPT